MCINTMLFIAGLIDLKHSMTSSPKIDPFPPGHYEVFDLKPSGKVASVELMKFRNFKDEPHHVVCDSVEKLQEGNMTAAPDYTLVCSL